MERLEGVEGRGGREGKEARGGREVSHPLLG